MDRWITDTQISPRFPYYTRANADEVGPDPFSPLGWSLGWAKGCIPGVAGGFIEFGVLAKEEFALDPPEVFGNWGGYFYNQLSLPRTMGVRMPGASPEAIDRAYFGDHPGVPPYIEDPGDNDEAATARLGETMGWVMSTDSFPAQDMASARAKAVVSARPDFKKLNDAELVAYARSMAPIIDEVWVPYCQSCLASSLGPGAVQAICAAIGRSDDAVTAMSGIGDIESADASFVMWDLSRTVRGSADLMAAFDGELVGLIDRLRIAASADAKGFVSTWDKLIATHGHRGPNEWDMRAHSWYTKPELALSMLERLRNQDDARSPHVAKKAAAATRESISAELLEAVAEDAETQGTLKAALGSAKLFFAMRERGKNAVIRVIHEAKLALLELGARSVAVGAVDDPQQLFMLLDSELDAFLADPNSHRSLILARQADFDELHRRIPPYIVKLEDGVPPISSWPVHGATENVYAAKGDRLQGGPGAPGVVRGRARVILDPSDPRELEPNDIMIAPTTDPSWTPLFLSVAGVVVNVGAVASHAAIVCREIGVPCAVSVVNATTRIPDGAMITIDGATGLVTIDEV